MKKLKFILPLLTLSLGLSGQTMKYDKLLISKKKPTVIINKEVISSFEKINQLEREQIKSINIYHSKTDQSAKLAKQFANLDEYGFMEITTAATIKATSFRELFQNLSIPASTPLFLDGYKISSLDLKIDPTSILKIEKLNHDPNNYNLTDFVNITTVNENSRSLRQNPNFQKIEAL